MTRILIVDDDDAIAELAAAGLQAHGHEVVRAANGVEGLDAFERTRPDILVTDLMMPEKEGWSLIADVRRRDREVLILAMTGGGLDTPRTYLKVAQQAGANGTLQKPFTIEQLLGAIAALREPKPGETPIIPAQRPRPARRPAGDPAGDPARGDPPAAGG